MTEEEKTTQKPGVRTKLNSGSNKVKLRDNSKSKKGGTTMFRKGKENVCSDL